MMGTVERIAGAALLMLILADVFLTVLYARMGTGVLSKRIGRSLWAAFRYASRFLGKWRPLALSFCGPVILLALLTVWVLGLSVAAALMIHPALGDAVRAGNGGTPRDFMTALVAGGGAISIVSAGDFSPHSAGYKLLYLLFSLIGMTITLLTLTYLMQVYNALQRRNTVGLRLHLLSGETNDAAEVVAGLGPEGQFSNSYSVLADLADEMSALKEAHHFYPVLFYFRFDESFYAVSELTLLSMDTVSLLRSAIDEQRFAWLQESGATSQLWRASMMLARALEDNFLGAGSTAEMQRDSRTLELWRRRYDAALLRLQQAHVPTVRDTQAGFETYKRLRSEWNVDVSRLAPALGYDIRQVDPMGNAPQQIEQREQFTARRHAPG